jgi:hypothetical protein
MIWKFAIDKLQFSIDALLGISIQLHAVLKKTPTCGGKYTNTIPDST